MKVILQPQSTKQVLKLVRDSLSMHRNSNFANCKALYINSIYINMAKGDEEKNAWHFTTRFRAGSQRREDPVKMGLSNAA